MTLIRDRRAPPPSTGACRTRRQRAPSPMARTLSSAEPKVDRRRRRGQNVLDRGRQEACLGRFRGLLAFGHEPPDREQHDNDDENDRPGREAAARGRRGGLGAPGGGFGAPRGGTGGRGRSGCGARSRRGGGLSRGRGDAAEAGEQSGGAERSGELPWKRGGDRAFLAVEQQKDRGGVRPA